MIALFRGCIPSALESVKVETHLLILRPHLSDALPFFCLPHLSCCYPINRLSMFWRRLLSCWPQCEHERLGSKFIPSVSSFSSWSTLPTIQAHPRPVTIEISPPTAISKVPAVMVDESDMYSALDELFRGRENYRVALDRDVYRIEASRKLTSVSAMHLVDGK